MLQTILDIIRPEPHYVIYYYNNGWVYVGYFKDYYIAEQYIKTKSKDEDIPYKMTLHDKTILLYNGGRLCIN